MEILMTGGFAGNKIVNSVLRQAQDDGEQCIGVEEIVEQF